MKGLNKEIIFGIYQKRSDRMSRLQIKTTSLLLIVTCKELEMTRVEQMFSDVDCTFLNHLFVNDEFLILVYFNNNSYIQA